MAAGLIGGVVLAMLGVIFEIMAQSWRRTAMRNPELMARTQEIKAGKEKSVDLATRIRKLTQSHVEILEDIDKLRVQVKASEARLPRITQDYRVVEEIGIQTPKTKRFDGTISNAKGSSRFAPVSEKSPPSYFANEVQIIVWAESLGDARHLFEESYPAKEGYQQIFHGDIFTKS